MAHLIQTSSDQGTPIACVHADNYLTWSKAQSPQAQAWLIAQKFTAKHGQMVILPNAQGQITQVVLGVCYPDDPACFMQLPQRLPKGDYFYQNTSDIDSNWLALTWLMGTYKFSRYCASASCEARLCVRDAVVVSQVTHCAEAMALAKDLINTPPQDMDPSHLAQAVQKMGESYQAQVTVVEGDELLKQGFPTIHAVGRSSSIAPRLIELHWGDRQAPAVCLVGKGVCFDSGGLDLKSASGMRTMKKDMAGAAHAIALAQMIMANNLPVHLRLLIPAVENSVSGNSFHPGDVITTRSGQTIEVHNTDAEGRLVLCDALTYASEAPLAMLFDFATLTGAARVALGTDIAAVFSNDKPMAHELLSLSKKLYEPMWQLPLYAPYKRLLKSDLADMSNCASISYGGAITAALYLQAFVDDAVPWAHFDLMAWVESPYLGQSVGADINAVRTVYAYIQQYCCSKE